MKTADYVFIVMICCLVAAADAAAAQHFGALTDDEDVLALLPGLRYGRLSRSVAGFTLGSAAPSGTAEGFEDPLTAVHFEDPLTAILFEDPLTAILFEDPLTARSRGGLRTLSGRSGGMACYVHSIGGRICAIDIIGAVRDNDLRDTLESVRSMQGRPIRETGGGLAFEDGATGLVVAFDRRAGFVMRMWDRTLGRGGTQVSGEPADDEFILALLPEVRYGRVSRAIGSLVLGNEVPREPGEAFEDPLTALGFEDPLTAISFEDPLTAILFEDPLTAIFFEDPLTARGRSRPRTYSTSSQGMTYYVHSLDGRICAIDVLGATADIDIPQALGRMRAGLGAPTRESGGGLVYEDRATALVVAFDRRIGFVLRIWSKPVR